VCLALAGGGGTLFLPRGSAILRESLAQTRFFWIAVQWKNKDFRSESLAATTTVSGISLE